MFCPAPVKVWLFLIVIVIVAVAVVIRKEIAKIKKRAVEKNKNTLSTLYNSANELLSQAEKNFSEGAYEQAVSLYTQVGQKFDVAVSISRKLGETAQISKGALEKEIVACEQGIKKCRLEQDRLRQKTEMSEKAAA